MHESEIVVVVLFMLILSGVTVLVMAMVNRRKMREMEHRERLAMIDRGLMPSPEADPLRFESASGLTPPPPSTERYRTAGVMMLGIGFGLMVLLTFAAGEPSVALGVGGGWAMLGAAALLNYYILTRRPQPPPMVRPWNPPSKPSEPPSNTAL